MDCVYKDPNAPVEARVKDLLSRMTLEEKIGQMTQIERSVATPDAVKNRFIGISLYAILLLFFSSFLSFLFFWWVDVVYIVSRKCLVWWREQAV